MDTRDQILFSINAIENFARAEGDQPLLNAALRAKRVAKAELAIMDEAQDAPYTQEISIHPVSTLPKDEDALAIREANLPPGLSPSDLDEG